MNAARLVVINDDPVQLRGTSAILERAGYTVRPYLDASEALDALSRREPSADLFVVDLHMPGIDGWKLCRLLRSPEFPHYNQVPVLIVSATFTGDDVERITRELGANAFLQVPFTAEELLHYSESLLQGGAPSRAPIALVVDDDAAVSRALVHALEMYGYDARQAASVAEATQVWSRERIDVALVDFHLPDGTGEELLERFQTSDSSTVALVMTGDSDPGLPVSLLARGADGYLRKPFDARFAIELARRSSRERSLMRVEAVLEKRTRELRASERKYRSLFAAVPDLMLVLDEALCVVAANPEAVKRLEGGVADLLDASFYDLVEPQTAEAARLGLEEIAEGERSSFETSLRAADGSALPVEVSGRAVDTGTGGGILLVARDLTERLEADRERRKLESQLQHAQRLESLGVLAGGVAHDFNNLLVGILGNASLSLMDLPEGSPVRESLIQIEVAARRAAELTNQILTFAGKSKVSEERVRLTDLVREMGQLVEPAISKKARVSYRLSTGDGLVQGDSGQIRQLVMNLIINASDALEGEVGTITVATAVRRMEEADLAGAVGRADAVPGTYVSLAVTDDGCGMSASTLQRIFEPFFTTKSGGRGLGLASTLGIVRSHDGYLFVDSKPGVGTTFTVLLPALPEEGQGGEGDGTQGASSSWTGGGTVLVVDDEEAVRGLARAVLLGNGFRVVEAFDGVEALDVMAQVGHDIDLVLLDLTMPRLSGIEVLTEVRRDFGDLPVLVSSGYTVDAVPADLLEKGPTGFVHKPYAPVDLMRAVSTLLSARVAVV